MKKAALHFIRRSRFIFRFALLLTALAVIDLIFASCARNLTGTYKADDGGVYYMEQSGSTLWWAGLVWTDNSRRTTCGIAALSLPTYSVEPSTTITQLWESGRILAEARHSIAARSR